MQKKTLSLLEELEAMHRERDSQYIIESRADNIIASAINLLDLIQETYAEKEAEDLTRKLLNSIRNRDAGKFKRAVGRINENRRINRSKLDG